MKPAVAALALLLSRLRTGPVRSGVARGHR